ncbi:class I SAM-dependent methyltransferase [Heyndrickxia ginsengihumi]|uniref:class I SAM-dependent methyltransferase n=1 Tax=Heyndrickxia ginsengihumi TaxID=363870 RepID=UPI003529A1BD
MGWLQKEGVDIMTYDYQDALAYKGISAAHPGGFSLTKKVLAKEHFSSQEKVLDAGCGTGLTTAYLSKEKHCKVYAIDIHPQMIKRATERMKKEKLQVSIVKGSLEKLPYPDHFFHTVIAESSIIFTNIPLALNELYRVLKPGGKLISIDMTLEEDLRPRELAQLKGLYHIEHFPNEQEWLGAFEKAGFKKVEILKSNTILQEIEEYTFSDNELNVMPEELPSDFNDILNEHGKMMMHFADRLGYRVFKAEKND